jgi:probable phosphoglycerate mutase
MHHVYLVRHGTTEDIEKRLMQGSSDSPLSARGREEAQRTAEILSSIRFDTTFSSPMGRARETAQILAGQHPGMEIILLNDLHEMDFGYYEKKPYFASPDEVPHGLKRLSLLAKIMLAQATGELLSSLSKRAIKSWAEIIARVPEGKVLIVSHGVLINYLLKYLLTKPDFEALKPAGLRPCSITELKVASPGAARILRFNDTTHLK